MLEAVNSVLQTSQLVRAQAEQQSAVDSFAANPDRVQKAPVQAPYVSPYIVVDINYDKAVIQLRNGDTGDVEDQFPSEATLAAQARRTAAQQVARENALREQLASSSSAPAPQAEVKVETSAPAPAPVQSSAPTQQQQAAFAAAAQAGNSNAGNVSLFA